MVCGTGTCLSFFLYHACEPKLNNKERNPTNLYGFRDTTNNMKFIGVNFMVRGEQKTNIIKIETWCERERERLLDYHCQFCEKFTSITISGIYTICFERTHP